MAMIRICLFFLCIIFEADVCVGLLIHLNKCVCTVVQDGRCEHGNVGGKVQQFKTSGVCT